MNSNDLARLDAALRSYLLDLLHGLGRVERRAALGEYVWGLLLDGERKSIQPMAARMTKESDAEGLRQRLQQAVVSADWTDDVVRQRLAAKVCGELRGLEALVVDDTGFPKKGKMSPGVYRQYSGTLGRVDNCQVAVSLHVAGPDTSACIALRLYLPESWANDPDRRKKAGIPEGVAFAKKWEIALQQLDTARTWGAALPSVVVADAGYGEAEQFRAGITERALHYVVAVPSTVRVWAPGTGPNPPDSYSGRGRPSSRHTIGDDEPITVADLAAMSGATGTEEVTWAPGRSSRFGAVRVRTARGARVGRPAGTEEWLIYEWLPTGETRHWLSSLPSDAGLVDLVRLAKLRWRIERDYQEMKGEIGLDHYEGRTWRGFHHHATLCMVAHAFLALQRALFPPGTAETMDPPAGEGPNPAPAHPHPGHVPDLPATDPEPLRRPDAEATPRASTGGANVIRSY